MSDAPNPGRGDGLPSRTRAHRGGGRSLRDGPPGRETSVATTGYRSEFLAIGNRTGSEKDRVGTLLTDFGRLAGEVAVLTLPTMLYLPFAGALPAVARFETWLLAATTTILVGTLVRNGVVTSLPFTDAPGWARLFPTLLLLRLLYFNATLLVAVAGGGLLAGATGVLAPGAAWAVLVAATATLLFPAAVDRWMARLG